MLDDMERSSESDIGEPAPDSLDELFPENQAKFTETRDNLSMRKDNVVIIFVTSRGSPCDNGARILEKNNRLPAIQNPTLGRANVTKIGEKLIALVIRDRISELTQLELVKESLHSLLNVTREVNLKTIYISKGDV